MRAAAAGPEGGAAYACACLPPRRALPFSARKPWPASFFYPPNAQEVAELFVECVQTDPAARPTAASLVARLEKLSRHSAAPVQAPRPAEEAGKHARTACPPPQAQQAEAAPLQARPAARSAC